MLSSLGNVVDTSEIFKSSVSIDLTLASGIYDSVEYLKIDLINKSF